jgi:hypothetical protein
MAPVKPTRKANPWTGPGALLVIALLGGAIMGGVLWAQSTRPMFAIVDSDGHLSGSYFVARATVRNIGLVAGEVTVTCEVSFDDGASFTDSVTIGLDPEEEDVVEFVVDLPQAYVLDRSGVYRIFIE